MFVGVLFAQFTSSIECDICGRPFNNLQQLQKHKRTHLNPEERKAFRCSYCGIMFDTVKLRERHEERHIDGETFDCENCQRSFSNEKNLAHHVRTHHSNNPKANEEAKTQRKKAEDRAKCHTCHICNSSQLFCLTSLRRHISRIHSTNFKCVREGCGKTFKSKYQFDTHEEQHKNRECHLCGKQFTRKQVKGYKSTLNYLKGRFFLPLLKRHLTQINYNFIFRMLMFT